MQGCDEKYRNGEGSRHPLTQQQRYAYGGYPAPNYRSLSLMMNSAPWRLAAVSGYPSIIAGGWLLPAGEHIFPKNCYCSFTGYFKETFPNFLDNADCNDKKFIFSLAFVPSANLSEYPPLVVAGV